MLRATNPVHRTDRTKRNVHSNGGYVFRYDTTSGRVEFGVEDGVVAIFVELMAVKNRSIRVREMNRKRVENNAIF